MKLSSILTACTLALLLPLHAALAQNPVACRSVQFSEEVLERFPDARESCLDVITRDGQDYAVFRAHFERASGNTMFVRIRKPDGSRGPLTRISTSPDFRVLVDGEEMRVNQLARNQELTAYVGVSRPMIAVAPARPEATLQVVPFVVVPAAEERMARAEGEPQMPSTAGLAPVFGTLGLVLVAAAACAIGVRRMRNAHRERLLRLP